MYRRYRRTIIEKAFEKSFDLKYQQIYIFFITAIYFQ